jgi:hypothetical protein
VTHARGRARAAAVGLALASAAPIGVSGRCAEAAETTAAAARSRVVLVGDARDPEVATLLSRLRGELGAAGFDVMIAPATGGDARASVEAADPGAFASVHVTRARTGVDVWIADRATGKTSVRHVAGKSPAEVALQVVELLRASLAELSMPEAPKPVEKVPEDVVRFAPTPAPSSSPSPGIATSHVVLGASASALFAGGHDWLGASLSLAWQRDALRLALSIDAPIAGSALESEAGRTRVTPALGFAQIGYGLRGDRPDRAMHVGLGLGALYVHARGEATDPAFRGETRSAFAFAAGPTLEARLRLAGPVWLTVANKLVIARPAPKIVVDGAERASLGGPILVVDLGLEVAL